MPVTITIRKCRPTGAIQLPARVSAIEPGIDTASGAGARGMVVSAGADYQGTKRRNLRVVRRLAQKSGLTTRLKVSTMAEQLAQQ